MTVTLAARPTGEDIGPAAPAPRKHRMVKNGSAQGQTTPPVQLITKTTTNPDRKP